MSSGGATATDVANEALGILGVKSIRSITDIGTTAEACRRMLPIAKRSLFRNHPWNSLMTRAELPAEVKAPVWGFTYKFKLPADYLRLWKINGYIAPSDKFRVERGYILANTAPLQILYVGDTTDYSILSPDLYETLAYKLAIKVHKLVGAKLKNIQDIFRGFEEAEGNAVMNDSAETQPEQPTGQDEWELYRQYTVDPTPMPNTWVDVDDI